MGRPRSNRRCTMPGCDKPHQARGYCWMHYQRIRRYGDPSVATKPDSNANGARTHCVNGHALTPDNVYVWQGNGKRQCRTCRRERNRRYYFEWRDLGWR